MNQTIIKVPTTEAADLIQRRGWTQGEYEIDGDGVCLHAAIQLCCPVPGDAHIIEQVAARRGRGTDWNDEGVRTVAEVLASLRSEPWDVTDADLAETFGPQWQPLVALVRRAAVLTPDEVRSLYVAWDAAMYAARAAARTPARTAAGAAAWALVVRDLIGQHGYTQDHYDTLSGPWRRVIGPVHPDDPPLGDTP